MTNYARLTVFAEYSRVSSYANPITPPTGWGTYALTPDECLFRELEVGTTAYTIDLGAFSSVTACVIQNLDATNYLEAEWFYQVGTQAAGDFAFADANPDTIADNNTNTTFLTNGAVDGGYVRVANSENSGENDGVFLISQAVDGDNLTLAPGESLTPNTDDIAATLSFERKNKQGIPPGGSANNGGYLVLGRNLVPDGDLVLQANTAAVKALIWIVGT